MQTLIEVERTMFVDSQLSIIFWTEAVNTTCYVLNMVLVVNDYNKAPYDIFL
jgi:hypothetical protein